MGDFVEWESKENEKYNLVISIEVLPNVKENELALFFKKVNYLLKEDGIFIFSVINEKSWRTILRKLIKKQSFKHPVYSTFNMNKCVALIKQGSFRIDRINGFLWIPCKMGSNSIFVKLFILTEKCYSLLHIVHGCFGELKNTIAKKLST